MQLIPESNSAFSCLCFPSAEITIMSHNAQLKYILRELKIKTVHHCVLKGIPSQIIHTTVTKITLEVMGHKSSCTKSMRIVEQASNT